MSREKKAKAAQLSVLSKYGVLADFSALLDDHLDRALKAPVAAKAAQEMTFASWCNQMMGQGVRVPVASFPEKTPGKTLISNLAVATDLGKDLKARDRQHQALIKDYQQQIEQLQAELQSLKQRQADVAAPAPVWLDTMPARLGRWYDDTTERLHSMLWEIQEIEGALFDHQGQLNRDYRQRIVEIIGIALPYLDSVGFRVDVQLQEVSDQRPAPEPVVLYQSPAREDDGHGFERFSFKVDGVQADVIEAAGDYIFPRQTWPTIEKQARFNCHVEVTVSRAHGLDKDDFFHVSCFLHKLFEAMARSGDKRPRGTLREKVILCLLLAKTAPCVTARTQRPEQELPRLQDTYFRGVIPREENRSRVESDVSAGKIVEHLLHIMYAQTR